MPIALDLVPQAAAVALRRGRVCVVTTKDGTRWGIPKGRLEKGKSLADIALQEAWEEAGLVGEVNSEPLGSYVYEKFGRAYHVTVYRMRVTEVVDDYPERDLRQRCWMTPSKAIASMGRPNLKRFLAEVLETN